jgi:hypothetical protein
MSRQFISISLALSFPLLVSQIAGATSPDIKESKTAAQIEPKAAPPQLAMPRCAYIGYWGSFHITGKVGTAAYWLGNKPYIADLSLDRATPSFFYYRPANGDPFITMWAFGRQPDCGRHWVWFRDRSGWRQYELTRAWGEGLDGTAGPVTTVNGGPGNEEILEKLRDIEGTVDTILENQLKAK